MRERAAARNLALPRRIARNPARTDAAPRAGPKGKRESAAWGDTFVATLING